MRGRARPFRGLGPFRRAAGRASLATCGRGPARVVGGHDLAGGAVAIPRGRAVGGGRTQSGRDRRGLCGRCPVAGRRGARGGLARQGVDGAVRPGRAGVGAATAGRGAAGRGTVCGGDQRATCHGRRRRAGSAGRDLRTGTGSTPRSDRLRLPFGAGRGDQGPDAGGSGPGHPEAFGYRLCLDRDRRPRRYDRSGRTVLVPQSASDGPVRARDPATAGTWCVHRGQPAPGAHHGDSADRRQRWQ
ncbi:hypothetical protein KIPE111705_01950 [Kibdelosporangium persicum]